MSFETIAETATEAMLLSGMNLAARELEEIIFPLGVDVTRKFIFSSSNFLFARSKLNIYSMARRSTADLFNLASFPATIFLSSMILSLIDDL